jgi:glycosyltransferase involved in cell wall biosynthesis
MAEPTNRRTRVALFLPNLGGGGAERVTVNLARGLADRGVAVDIVLVKAIGPFCAQVPNGVRIIDLHSCRAATAIIPLARYLRKERPEVLLAALDYANVCALLAKRMAFTSTRLVVAIHSVHSYAAANDGSWKGHFQRFLMRRFYRWADAAVAVSHGVGKAACEMNGIPFERMHVIYNPVISPELYIKAAAPLDHAWFAPEQPKVILAVGSLSPGKDFATLIRAFALFCRRHDARLIILGDGSQRATLESLIQELGVADRVSLPGFVSNPYAFMSRAAVLVLSSRHEALPTVLIEALALGVSVVSTDCDFGPREILAGGKYGMLTPVGDASSLANALEQVFSTAKPAVPPESLQAYEFDTAVEKYLKVLLGDEHA